MKRKLFTTSEYLGALKLQADGNMYECWGRQFGLFASAAAAEYDAQWLVNHCKLEGIRKRKPVVYRIRLERVK